MPRPTPMRHLRLSGRPFKTNRPRSRPKATPSPLKPLLYATRSRPPPKLNASLPPRPQSSDGWSASLKATSSSSLSSQTPLSPLQPFPFPPAIHPPAPLASSSSRPLHPFFPFLSFFFFFTFFFFLFFFF